MADDTACCGRCRKVQPLDAFYVRRGRPDTVWCKSCYREWHRSRYAPKDGAHDESRECRQCGKEYRPTTRRPSWFCSRDCKGRHRIKQDSAAKLAAKQGRICIRCACPIPAKARREAVFCSEECNSAAHSTTRGMFRRAGQWGRGSKGFILLAQLGERDGWRCGICRKPVDPMLRRPDVMSPTIDHIVPLARGGTNDNGNLQVAHLRCNCSKRADLVGNAQPHLF